ncbi:hypothetical protein [Limihaloglobus sulfuriphilus]|nr:hypothetical protein [Limihaloglobus sulfuriphilus]
MSALIRSTAAPSPRVISSRSESVYTYTAFQIQDTHPQTNHGLVFSFF